MAGPSQEELDAEREARIANARKADAEINAATGHLIVQQPLVKNNRFEQT